GFHQAQRRRAGARRAAARHVRDEDLGAGRHQCALRARGGRMRDRARGGATHHARRHRGAEGADRGPAQGREGQRRRGLLRARRGIPPRARRRGRLRLCVEGHRVRQGADGPGAFPQRAGGDADAAADRAAPAHPRRRRVRRRRCGRGRDADPSARDPVLSAAHCGKIPRDVRHRYAQRSGDVRQAWRWYGPDDPVTLDHVRQAGAAEIVSALHQYPPGVAWPRAAVAERKALIENTPRGRTPLEWTIIESIPVPDDIQREGAGARDAIEAWIASMEAVAAEGIRTICYNVMPVVDWTRTDLDYPMPTGATALRFDYDRFAAFDLHVLKRKGAEAEYDAATRARARKVADGLTQSETELLTRNISAGLPGATTFSANLDAFRG